MSNETKGSKPSGVGHSPPATYFHYAERLDLPLEPGEAVELNQLADRIHQDLKRLRNLALDSLEPPLVFRPGGSQKE